MILLLRHGHSSPGHPSLADRDRPLSPQGKAECAYIANILKVKNITIDYVLCSSAVRTVETYQEIATYMPLVPAQRENSLYLASPETMLALLQHTPLNVRTVLMIAHNPGISALGRRLLSTDVPHQASLGNSFATCGLAIFGFACKDWGLLEEGTCALQGYFTPNL